MRIFCLSLGSFSPSDQSFLRCPARFSACLSDSWLQATRALSKRSELLRCSARFLAFRLSFSPFSSNHSENALAKYEVHVQVVAELPASDTQQREPLSQNGASSVTVVLSTFVPEWFTQALFSLQSQLAETRSAVSEVVAATQMLSTDVLQLKRPSATSSAPPPKLPKLSKPGLAVQQEFNAGIIQAMDNALSTLPEGSDEAAKYLQEAPQRSNDCFLCGQRCQAQQGRRHQLTSSSTPWPPARGNLNPPPTACLPMGHSTPAASQRF